MARLVAVISRRVHLLFLAHAGHVGPDGDGSIELARVDEDEHQHGVNHHRHPEILQDSPPPLVMNLKNTAFQTPE